MNITLLANKDVASCLALNYLWQDLQNHRLSIFLSSRVGSKPLPPLLQQLKFVEQDLFNQIIFPLLNDHSRGQTEMLGFDQLREEIDGRLAELNTINQEEGLCQFAATEPDIVLSIRYGVILKDAALAIPRHGVLNLHSGRLPDYKGVMATFWALLNGEDEIGTSLHFIEDSSIDTGRIVATTSMPVDSRHSYLWHVLKLYREGCGKMIEAVSTIDRGDDVTATPQAPGGHYFSFPTDADLERFTSKGWRLWDPEEVSSLARSFMTVS